MLGKKNYILNCKQKEVIATDKDHALFIEAFLRFSRTNQTYLPLIEVADINHYKLHKKKDKIKHALKAVHSRPFIFVIHKN
jgi:hypothetical protein